ncbi:YicC/YloC family endoribonuclease [Reinekea marina]|uniref:YicC/YloC family endoribonuclease n=1 Tax=Reinekea marina TaxID=1310421 RepID=A0ABV7WUU6_9GAMM|nr:YicC/YloC family endoribonuclease [Reinekea marina]MDN3647445.1 YicC/YloC family endoribonuclease [Reinekea marina]
MTYSMTAFARKEQSFDFGTLSIEIKSVNQRYLEPTFRLPETLRPVEMKLRERLKQKVKRGKLEVNVRFYAQSGADSLGVDEARLTAVQRALEKVQAQVTNTAPVNPLELLQYPGVLIDEALDIDAVNAALLNQFNDALTDFLAGRTREGEVLANAIAERLDDITTIVAAIREEAPEWVQTFRDNLREKALNLGAEINPDRLEQEVVMLAQKADVAEELDRLDGHVKECRSILKQKGAVGRKLDFLMQEFNREANTLGSKATKESITRNAVQLKVLIEQMREQVQNIE